MYEDYSNLDRTIQVKNEDGILVLGCSVLDTIPSTWDHSNGQNVIFLKNRDYIPKTFFEFSLLESEISPSERAVSAPTQLGQAGWRGIWNLISSGFFLH